MNKLIVPVALLLAVACEVLHVPFELWTARPLADGAALLRQTLAWSLVALAELGDNGEPDFNAGEPFRRQGQAKFEYAAPAGTWYLGVTGGARQGHRLPV